MKKTRYLFFIIICFLILVSCHKVQQLSSVPHIEYTSFTIFDTTDILGNNSKGGRLKFHFEDGDGDVGLDAPTGDQTDSTNLFFTLFRKEGGVMLPAPDNDPLKPSAYRIPYMERLGQNKIMKGTISVTFLYLFYSPADTIRYDFYIKDRALNESNVASTSEIVLSANNTYK
ncbi:MAG: hypothetical protein ABR927_01440 [Bacteroidales bacterium]|jgi:hypothetical protein